MCVAAVFRVSASIIGAHLFGVFGAVAAAVLAEALLGGILWVAIRPTGREQGAVVGATVAGATSTQVAMWLVVNVDLLWARRLLNPVNAGRYLLVGGVTVGLVSFGQAFLWHRAATAIADDVGIDIVLRAAGIVAAAAVLAAPVAAFALPRLLGPSFSNLTPLICVGATWAVLASVVNTSTATQIIAGDRGLWRILPLAAVAITVPPIAVACFGARPVVLACAALANTTVGAVVIIGPQFLRARRRRAPVEAVVPDPDMVAAR
jgi:hypothetical protein